MPRSRKEYGECRRKRRYKTGAKAEKMAARYGLRAYRCPWCAGWHLTNWSAAEFIWNRQQKRKREKEKQDD